MNLRKKTAVTVDGVEVKMESTSKFCKRLGITPQALSYARGKGFIDVWQEGHATLILLTEKTLAYKPNSYLKRRKAAKRKG